MKKIGLEKAVAVLLLALGSFYLIWAAHPVWEKQWLNDDSFITLTYAKNLVLGNGFVYNHPPATLGTTTPLFTLLVAGLAWIVPLIDVVDSAIILSVAAWIGTGIVLYLIAIHLKFRPLAAAMVALIPLTIVNSIWLWFIGMEIWLFQFLLVLSFYLALTRRQGWTGVTVGLLFLTRGEGALVGGILAAYFLLISRRIPIRFIAAALAVFSVWAAYAFLTFGTVLPNTLTAKIAHREFLGDHGRNYGFLPVISGLIPKWVSWFNLGSSILTNVFLGSAVIGLVATFVKKQLYWSFFVVWALVYFLGYAIINPSTYAWYALHFYFVLEVMAGVGIGWLINTTFSMSGRKKLGGAVATILLTTLLVGPNLIRGINSIQAFKGDGRAPAYITIADWLNQNSHPEEGIAYLEIGYLGYYSQNRIIDLAGLIDPVIASNIANQGFTWGFWHYKPKYFLYNPGMDNTAYLADIRSAVSKYKEVARFPGGPDGTPLVLFQRIEEKQN